MCVFRGNLDLSVVLKFRRFIIQMVSISNEGPSFKFIPLFRWIPATRIPINNKQSQIHPHERTLTNMYSGCLTKSGTYSFHRTGAVSSRRGLTDRSGSLVPPDHNQGHTGRWFEPLAQVRCGTSSSSHSGSQAGLDRSRFGTPLREEIKNKRLYNGVIACCLSSLLCFSYFALVMRVKERIR